MSTILSQVSTFWAREHTRTLTTLFLLQNFPKGTTNTWENEIPWFHQHMPQLQRIPVSVLYNPRIPTPSAQNICFTQDNASECNWFYSSNASIVTAPLQVQYKHVWSVTGHSTFPVPLSSTEFHWVPLGRRLWWLARDDYRIYNIYISHLHIVCISRLCLRLVYTLFTFSQCTELSHLSWTGQRTEDGLHVTREETQSLQADRSWRKYKKRDSTRYNSATYDIVRHRYT